MLQIEVSTEGRRAFMMDIKRLIRGKILFHVLMKDLTSLKIGGRADILAFPLDEEDLRRLLRYTRRLGIPYYVIGRCTNLLVKDGGIRGLLIDLSKGFNKIKEIAPCEILAETGVSVKRILDFCVERGLEGLEFVSGIPGSLGGAIVMNAGAYGGEMKDVVVGVEVMGEDGVVREIGEGGLSFSYRGSNLGSMGILLRASLRLRKGDKQKIMERMDSYFRRKASTQAVSLPNAGSIFKNPSCIPAGRLIEELGLKGLRVGDAKISEIHGNYVVNMGDASSQDVLTLIDLVKERAMGERGIHLEPEIKFIGED